jgi:hypothetical protein
MGRHVAKVFGNMVGDYLFLGDSRVAEGDIQSFPKTRRDKLLNLLEHFGQTALLSLSAPDRGRRNPIGSSGFRCFPLALTQYEMVGSPRAPKAAEAEAIVAPPGSKRSLHLRRDQ